MSQIEIRILKQGVPSRKVLTCCFFTVGEAYRDFKHYVQNLRQFIGYTQHLTEFEVRIYTDDTGKDYALEIANKFPRVSVLHYNCPEFRNGNGHMGMFGTLVRFLPMFEDLDIVWCSDIDIPADYLNKRLLKKIEDNKADIYIRTILCYERKEWARKNSILAGAFITKVQFPRALLTRFLNMLDDGRISERLEKINKQNRESLLPKSPSKVPYGTDELFLNTYIYNWIINNNIKVMLNKDYLPTWLAFKLIGNTQNNLFRSYYYNPTHSTFLEIKKILERAEPNPELLEVECYREFKETLPKLRTSFIKTIVFNGADLEKV
jgi:hypothetical protein